ncbi:hypothetical protein E3N88_12901 [Mikania micrantha]|uniref:RRM domain-containing protein n=1 Tax=Mikania micrantha TaxID=192012 RepID=A0A5N6P8N0_9ASTR|nr:hypothetical protein E3N88_12901 [Mikania micrantha]
MKFSLATPPSPFRRYFQSSTTLPLATLATFSRNHRERSLSTFIHDRAFTRRTGIANLFVKNLDLVVTRMKLEEVFGKFRRILCCKIAKDDNTKSRGSGFVQFDSEESANNALKS